jgi:hydroxymethylpyrimidine/phosphomethylpyrimidine kinase
LAKGLPLPKAVGEAKRFITRAIKGSRKWGKVAALDQVQRGG